MENRRAGCDEMAERRDQVWKICLEWLLRSPRAVAAALREGLSTGRVRERVATPRRGSGG